MKKNKSFRNKWDVFSENHSSAYICLMIIAVNLIFILGSSLLIALLPENQGRTVPEILRLAFTLMVNPSGRYTYSDAPISLVFTTIVVLLGMISLTGGTVGFVTSVITGFLEKTANSKTQLKLRDHIVILNYNQRVPAVLCDYCFDDPKYTYVVILTDKDKNSVLASIDEMYNRMGRKKRFRNIIVRSGSPISPLEMERINLAEAKTILLMTPDDDMEETPEDRGFAVSKLFLSVTTFLASYDDHGTDLVVETTGEDMDKMVREYRYRGSVRRVISINYDMVIGKILGVTAIMPEINDVLRQLFSFEGIETYTRPVPAESIDEELRTSRSVLPLFDNGNYRVYLAENEKEFSRVCPAAELKKEVPAQKIVPDTRFSKNEIIIVGTNRKLPYILESLICFKKKYSNSDLHVILADTEAHMENIRAYYADPAYADILLPGTFEPVCIHDIYRPMDDLSAMVNGSADTLLFLSDEDAASRHVDEKPLLYWSDIRTRMSSDPNVIIEIRDPINQSILQKKNSDQILVSDDFLGKLYAQLGKNPLRKDIIMDMITSEGDTSAINSDNEEQDTGDLMCLRAASVYGTDQPITFSSKRELILWTAAATDGKVIPVGCVKKGVTYLFSRTDDEQDGLDSCVLLGIQEGMTCPEPTDKLVIRPDDIMVMFVFS